MAGRDLPCRAGHRRRARRMRTPNAICETCGTGFYANYDGRRTCSMACRRARPIALRLWEKVDRSGGPDACWPWTGARTRQGYGYLLESGVGSKRLTCSRLVLELTQGVIPDGLFALHSCDNPPCCNPKHLRVGTREDNAQDSVRRGRARSPVLRGEQHPRAKLTYEKAQCLRRWRDKGLKYSQLARRFNVSETTVYNVVKGKSWTAM